MIPNSDADPQIGRTLGGQYRIEALLGCGGMGRVYRGVQLSVKRPVAIKLIAGGSPSPAEWTERFRREAEATARLSHPNTVRLFDFGVTEAAELFMVMELLEGETLAQFLARSGPLPLPAALSIARQVLLALSEAHALGIVHRDIKPDNVFLAQVRGGDMVAKVMDFGIAGLTHASTRLTSTGVVIGTPAYMSPEQAQGHGVDARSDVYSLGVVLFEMLTGKPVFESNTALTLLLQHVSAPPRPLAELGVSLPQQAAVQALLDGLLAKDPEHRPTTRIALVRVETLSGIHTEARALSGTQLAVSGHSQERPVAKSRALALPAVSAPLPAAQSEPAPEVTYHVPLKTPWQLYALATLVLAAAGTLALRSLPRLTRQVQERDTVTDARPASAPPLREVTLSSMPSGASVLSEGRELGKTPYAFSFREPTELWIAQRGYQRQRLRLTEDSPRSVSVTLPREVGARVESPRAPPRAAGPRPPPPSAAIVQEAPPEPNDPVEPQRMEPAAPLPAAAQPGRDPAREIAERFDEYRRHAQAQADRVESARPEPTLRSEPSAEADEAAEAESHQRGHGLRALGRMLMRAVGKVLIPYPDRGRREALAGQPLRYLSFREARQAYDRGELDKVGFQEAVWQLRERRRRGIEEERDRYARGVLSQAEYEARVDRVWNEFWGK